MDDTQTGWSVGASFPAQSGSLEFTATAIQSNSLDALEALLEPDHMVLGAWEFAASGSGYQSGEPIYLSFDTGSGYSRADFAVWHYDGSQWSSFDAMDLAYDGRYAGFTVTA